MVKKYLSTVVKNADFRVRLAFEFWLYHFVAISLWLCLNVAKLELPYLLTVINLLPREFLYGLKARCHVYLIVIRILKAESTPLTMVPFCLS